MSLAEQPLFAQEFYKSSTLPATAWLPEFVRDEQLQPDSSTTSFIELYLNLVWGEYEGNEITSPAQLRRLVQRDFQSAYFLYEGDIIGKRV